MGTTCHTVYSYTPPGIGASLFVVLTNVLAFVSVVFWMWHLNNSRSRHVAIYFNFIVFACFTFFFSILVSLLPHSQTPAWSFILTILHIVYVALQWFVQVAAVLFMMEKGIQQEHVRRTTRRATALCVLLSFAWIVAYLAGDYNSGGVFTELILAVCFFLVLLMPIMPEPIARHKPRRAAIPWSLYQCVAHLLFGMTDALVQSDPGVFTEAASCTFIISFSFYYLLYAPLLYYTLNADSEELRKSMGLLANSHEVTATAYLSDERIQALVKELSSENIPIVPWADLQTSQLIGVGQHGEVFKAVHRPSGRPVAVKRFKPIAQHQVSASSSTDSFAYDEDLVVELLKEATMMQELEHPNVLSFLGVCIDHGNYCVITEFMDRGCLFNILRYFEEKTEELRAKEAAATASQSSSSPSLSSPPAHTKSTDEDADASGSVKDANEARIEALRTMDVNVRAMPWKLTLQIARDTAAGMEYLHLRSPIIIHRDLKSQNLLLNQKWTTKVADFGISRVKGLTQTMTRVGTSQWMAPEVLREEKYSEKADVYSFGMVLWELVTLKPPFEGISPLSVIYNVAHMGISETIPESTPEPLAQIIRDCFNADPKARPTFTQISMRLSKIRVE